mgnify:CR=1 FL=1
MLPSTAYPPAGTTRLPLIVWVSKSSSLIVQPSRSTSSSEVFAISNHSPALSGTADGFCMISVTTRSPTAGPPLPESETISMFLNANASEPPLVDAVSTSASDDPVPDSAVSTGWNRFDRFAEPTFIGSSRLTTVPLASV